MVHTPTSRDKVLELIFAQASGHMEDQKLIVATPGLVTRSGKIGAALYSPLHDIDLAERLGDDFARDILVINDAKLQACRYLYSKGIHLHITIGTAVGGAITLDRSLLGGDSGLAGEIGHVRVAASSRSCPCGRIGCADTLASGWSLQQDLGPGWWLRRSMVTFKRVNLAGRAIGEAIGEAARLLDLTSFSISGHLARSKHFNDGLAASLDGLHIARRVASRDSWNAARMGALQLERDGGQLHYLPRLA